MTAIRLVLALALVAGALGPAAATGDLADRTLSKDDKGRIAAFVATRVTAIEAARTGGDPAEVAVLDKLLAGGPDKILGQDIRGDYRCRVAKLDGILPLVIYDWFRCRIVEDDKGYRLDKLTGSQRLTLWFIDDADVRLLAYGADHYDDEKPRRYGEDPSRDVVGYMVKAGPGHYRVEQPLPKLEANFEILELQKR